MEWAKGYFFRRKRLWAKYHFLKTYTNNRVEDQLFQMLYILSIDQIVDDKTLRIG